MAHLVDPSVDSMVTAGVRVVPTVQHMVPRQIGVHVNKSCGLCQTGEVIARQLATGESGWVLPTLD